MTGSAGLKDNQRFGGVDRHRPGSFGKSWLWEGSFRRPSPLRAGHAARPPGGTPGVFRAVLAGSDDGLWVWRAGTPRRSAAPGRAAAQAGSRRGCPRRRPGGEKQAETAFDAASDRFAAEQALDEAPGEPAQARQERYAARLAHEQAEPTAKRIPRRVDELSRQLGRME